MYKVISFDIGGTLLETGVNNGYGLSSLYELIDLPKDIVRKVYKDIFQKKKGTLLELVTLFCDELNIPLDDRLMQFFNEKFNESNNKSKLNEDAYEVILKLKDKGYKIILFSNSCCLINNQIDSKLMENIDRVFYSYDLGYTKSDSEAYEIVLKELGCTGKEILHIGDTLSSDYIKPIENGWNAIYYGKIDDSSIVSIQSLRELLDGKIYGGMVYGEKRFNKRRTS